MTLQLEPAVEQELARYALLHGLQEEQIVNTAIREYLEDREDYQAAVLALREHEADGRTYSLEEVRKELGLED